MLDISSLGNTQDLPSYVQVLLNQLHPILEKLDESKLDDTSKIEIKKQKSGWYVHLTIVPVEKNVPSISLFASEGQCIFDFAGGEQIECHTNSGKDETLVDMVVKATKECLEGITILDSYNRFGKLIHKECFLGVVADSGKNRKIGDLYYFLTFPKKVCSTRKTMFRFLKDSA